MANCRPIRDAQLIFNESNVSIISNCRPSDGAVLNMGGLPLAPGRGLLLPEADHDGSHVLCFSSHHNIVHSGEVPGHLSPAAGAQDCRLIEVFAALFASSDTSLYRSQVQVYTRI